MPKYDPLNPEDLKKHDIYSDEFHEKYQINKALKTTNMVDKDENPTGGNVRSVGLKIDWQNGPRGKADGTLAEPNGAFIEDVIYAALERLAFFQQSKYACVENSEAAAHLREALASLQKRSSQRAADGKLGKHEV